MRGVTDARFRTIYPMTQVSFHVDSILTSWQNDAVPMKMSKPDAPGGPVALTNGEMMVP